MTTLEEIKSAPSLDILQDMINCAMGKLVPDLIIEGGTIVDVLTRSLYSGTLLVKHGKIVAILDSSTFSDEMEQRLKQWKHDPSCKTLNVTGKYLVPSFMDAHVHFESSMLTLSNFAKESVKHGTGLIVIDPHEITNVLGTPILRELSQILPTLPLFVVMEVPSCVPAAAGLEFPAQELTSKDIQQIFDDPSFNVDALAEMMNYPGVIFTDPEILQRILAAWNHFKLIEGHAPGLSGTQLDAYITASIRSDHESTKASEVREKLYKGMTIQLRDGSVASDLEPILTDLLKNPPADWRQVILASDDKHPDDLINKGHIDESLRKVIRLGLDPVLAIQLATINPATHLGIHHFLGSLTPGKWANITVLSDLTGEFRVETVIFKGKLVVENQVFLAELPPEPIPSAYLQTVHLPADLTIDDLYITAPEHKGKSVQIRVIKAIEQSLLTEAETAVLHVDEQGILHPDPSQDLLLLLVLDRHHNTKMIGKAIIRGFGLKKGAVASTIAHDSHNLVVVGADYPSLFQAIQQMQKQQGGIVVTDQNRVLASLPLPYAGLLSPNDPAHVAQQLAEVRAATRSLGSTLSNVEMTLAFMALPVIPKLKLTNKGLVDVTRFQFTNLILDK